MLDYATPGTGLTVSVDDVVPALCCSTPAARTSQVLSSICSADAIATTGGTTPVGAVVALAPLPTFDTTLVDS
jgi:hypothetical protein